MAFSNYWFHSNMWSTEFPMGFNSRLERNCQRWNHRWCSNHLPDPKYRCCLWMVPQFLDKPWWHPGWILVIHLVSWLALDEFTIFFGPLSDVFWAEETVRQLRWHPFLRPIAVGSWLTRWISPASPTWRCYRHRLGWDIGLRWITSI